MVWSSRVMEYWSNAMDGNGNDKPVPRLMSFRKNPFSIQDNRHEQKRFPGLPRAVGRAGFQNDTLFTFANVNTCVVLPEFCTEISKISHIHHQIGVPLHRRLF